MERLLARLDRRIEWTLLSPTSVTMPGAELRHREDLLRAVRQARSGCNGLAPEPRETDPRFTDAGAWHLVAKEHTGQIAGAIRLNIIDRRQVPLRPADILRFGHVKFPSDLVRDKHLLALECLFSERADEPIFITAGGLFATIAWRRSGLAAVLGVAAIAMARLHRSRFSVTFTAARERAPELFDRLGGKPPQLPDGQSLGPFVCGRHGIPVQLLVFDSMRPDFSTEQGVALLAQRLRELTFKVSDDLYTASALGQAS